tara:strand:- start:2282 stop:2809 length:528 start_codon:yes stop_codon:yes gene_type:complete
MAYQKLQAGRVLQVVPADAINIPNPAAVAANGISTSDGRAANQLIDSNATFLDDKIKVGDIIYATTGGTSNWTLAATVKEVVNATTLEVENSSSGAATLFNTGLPYRIFSQVDNPQNGCCLYIGDVAGGTNIEVDTAGGDPKILFVGVNAGQFMPVNVLRVYKTNTTAASILALW